MTDGDALLAAIIANHADDTPRLVYADWLDEHGESDRAEYIRLECRLARRPRRGYGELKKQSKERLGPHAKEWFTDRYPFLYKTGLKRGFLHWCSLPARRRDATVTVDQLRFLLAREPVERLVFHSFNADETTNLFYLLAGCGPCPSLAEVRMSIPYLRADDVPYLFDSPLVSTCRVVRLNRCDMGGEALAAFGRLVSRRKFELRQDRGYQIIRTAASLIP